MATFVIATEEENGVGVPDFERPEVEHTLIPRYSSVYRSNLLPPVRIQTLGPAIFVAHACRNFAGMSAAARDVSYLSVLLEAHMQSSDQGRIRKT